VPNLAGFLALSLVVIAAPGPDTALVVRNVLRSGRASGYATSVGVATGLMIWTVAASIGVAALIRSSEPAFVALKVVGAAYLVYLGARSLWDAFRGRVRGQVQEGEPQRDRVSLRQGVLSNLGNPKIAIFFTSFLPQFVPGKHPSFVTLLLLGSLFSAITLVWLIAYSALVARAGDVLRRGGVKRALDAVTGAVLVGFGVRLALERR
jgi:RhtB (resistance to homoserine/threonine) family protein